MENLDFNPISESSFTKERVTRKKYETLKKQHDELSAFILAHKEIISKQSMSMDSLYTLTTEDRIEYNNYQEKRKDFYGYAFNVSEEKYEIIN
jgi:hypothetical protein